MPLILHRITVSRWSPTQISDIPKTLIGPHKRWLWYRYKEFQHNIAFLLNTYCVVLCCNTCFPLNCVHGFNQPLIIRPFLLFQWVVINCHWCWFLNCSARHNCFAYFHLYLSSVFFLIRILIFWPRLIILIFLQIFGWKYFCKYDILSL